MQLPISVKGIILRDNEVLLLKNERDEWELPGGRLEEGEQPKIALTREIKEELQIACQIERPVDAWVYEVIPGKRVFIVSYLCRSIDLTTIHISEEHTAFGWFTRKELDLISLPIGYKKAINKVLP